MTQKGTVEIDILYNREISISFCHTIHISAPISITSLHYTKTCFTIEYYKT